MLMNNKVYLLIGGNLGDREAYLQGACNQLNERCGTITKTSGIYETAAWGFTDQPSFLNQAIELSTSLSAPGLLCEILSIEKLLGREREVKFGPRLIDIDILFYNTDVFKEEHLTIPHPELQNRQFALEPLNELAPELVHPVLGKTIAQLLQDCGDRLSVKKFTGV